LLPLRREDSAQRCGGAHDAFLREVSAGAAWRVCVDSIQRKKI